MKTFKLKGHSIGVVFGTFAPMHVGHVDVIHRAKRENDGVVVVVSGTNTDRDRGHRVGLGLNRRFRYVREVFANDELVQVVKLDESDMPGYPNGWTPWLKELKHLITSVTYDDYDLNNTHLYVGEAAYKQEIKERWPEVTTTLVERSAIKVSATEIRNDPYRFWSYLTKPFRRHFTKKVLILGSASGGKTTLVKDLARVYNAPYSLEYARHYQETYNVRDDELKGHDYMRLLDGQYAQTSAVIDEGSHTGLVIADTNSTVTKAYYDYYHGDSASRKEKATIDYMYQAILARETWDLVILVKPNAKYVDDGFRDMTMADDAIRDAFTDHLLDLLSDTPFVDKLHVVDGDFYQNYQTVRQLIETELTIAL